MKLIQGIAPAGVPEPATYRYFIADLHLDGTDTERAEQFRALLARLSTEAASRPVELYILGDLFEFWYEYRAALFEIYRKDLSALDSAFKAGVKIFLFYGNRDFAYGNYVTRRFGATVLGDGEAITLNDSRPVWLEHGDLLCTSDRKYLRFRSIIRSGPVRLAFWMMPWRIARGAIDRLRRKSMSEKSAKPAHTMEIDPVAARQRLEKHRCRVLMCGHTHKPKIEDLGAGYQLIVLPPWCEVPGGYLDNGEVLKKFQEDRLSKKQN